MSTTPSPTTHPSGGWGRAGALATLLGPLGVVFGDIGTSPLYAFREAAHGLGNAPAAAVGIASVFIWTLLLVITGKYAYLVLRADHHGQGGIVALLGLLREGRPAGKRTLGFLTIAITFGAALLFADGIITPAISVLSAWEGLQVAGAAPHGVVILLTLATLFGLAFVQHMGTKRISQAFGPLMLLWFIAISAVAVPWIWKHPAVLLALDPRQAIAFAGSLTGMHYLILMGNVMLCITGGEALYADMGHFNRSSIRRWWNAVVFPGLALNYLGQAARFLDPLPIPGGNTFYALVPRPLLIPMVVLATIATIIASQALISGSFSLVNQAIQMRLMPRMRVIHTSANEPGQIYIPSVNRAICIGAVLLVLQFGTSSGLSGAYGLAVSGTMAVTSIGLISVALLVWRWAWWKLVPLGVALLLVDANFIVANAPKLPEGGYLPLITALVLAGTLRIWQRFRSLLFASSKQSLKKTVGWLLNLIRHVENAGGILVDAKGAIGFSSRALVFLCSSPVRSLKDPLPLIARVYLKRHGVLPGHIILLHVHQLETPQRPEGSPPFEAYNFDERLLSIVAHYGYMEQPHIGIILEDARRGDPRIKVDAGKWTVVVGEEEIALGPDLSFLQRFSAWVFRLLLHWATPAHYYFGVDQQYVLTPSINTDLLPPIHISKEVIRVEVHKNHVQHLLPAVELPYSKTP